MTSKDMLLAGTIAAFFAYPILMRVVARAVQPSRLAMASLGCELLASPDLSKDHKFAVKSMLVDAYDWRVAALMIGAIFAFTLKLATGRLSLRLNRIPRSEVGEKFKEFSKLHTLSMAAASPVFFLVGLLVFFAVCLPVVALFGRGTQTDASDLVIRANAAVDKRLGYCPA